MTPLPPELKRALLLSSIEAVAVALCGVGAGLAFGLGIGLLTAGGLLWTNITLGGLRRK